MSIIEVTYDFNQGCISYYLAPKVGGYRSPMLAYETYHQTPAQRSLMLRHSCWPCLATRPCTSCLTLNIIPSSKFSIFPTYALCNSSCLKRAYSVGVEARRHDWCIDECFQYESSTVPLIYLISSILSFQLM